MAGWVSGWVWQGWWLLAAEALGGEGDFDTAGGVALVAGHALQAAVVVQVAGAGCAHAVELSMGELGAFYVHLDLFCRKRAEKFKKYSNVIQRYGWVFIPAV